jgi:(R)-2-hydroxyacyl-CoA dehydratese activating ATPase
MVPQARLIIDIGGQDSKTIAVDAKGLVTQFAMNDRCAAGTGKFLEVLARAMAIALDRMGETALAARQELKISSMCASFAETEVISLLAEGQTKPDVLGAVHAAIATRTAGLVARVGKHGPVVMTGGVAHNAAAVLYIEKAIGMPVILPAIPQIAGALGAALIGLDDYLADCRPQAPSLEDDDPLDRQMSTSQGSCAPACKGTRPVLEIGAQSRPPADLWRRINAHI